MNPASNRAEISCDGKDRLTQGRAVQVALEMRRRDRRRMHAYRCSFCGEWHVGSSIRMDQAKPRNVKGGFRG
jgi:hypothetical protein